MDGKSRGIRMSSGVKVQQSTFKKYMDEIIENFYDRETDSWFMRTSDGIIVRAAWPNAFQNPKYPMLRTRDEASSMLRNISG